MSPVARALLAMFELLSLKDGVLFLLPAASNNKNWKPRIVLPETLIMSTLEQLHGGIEGGYLGRFKTLKKLQARFWRPGLVSAVNDYCTSCQTCADASHHQLNRRHHRSPCRPPIRCKEFT